MVTTTEDIDPARLEHWLGTVLPDFAGPVRVDKFPGGQSNPTYRVSNGSRNYVLRRKPSGALLPSAHAVDREYRLLRSLHPVGFPVPAPLGLCEDTNVAGTMFYLMEMVEGRTFWDGTLPLQPSSDRRAIYLSMVQTLARLHGLTPASIGLGDFGRPGNYFQRQIARWTNQYRSAQTDDIPEMDWLIEWLPKGIPEQTRTSILHGDYRIDNLIFSKEGAEIAAVIDWELATLGDPLADFTYFAMSWILPSDGRSGLAGVDLPHSGIPTLEEVCALYCELTNRDALPNFNWYFAYNMFRLASIVQGIKKRIIDGNASSSDAERTVSHLMSYVRLGQEHALQADAS